MAITKATNLASVGSGLGTQPAQPIDVGIGITLDGNTGIISALNATIDGSTGSGTFGSVTIDGSGIGIVTASIFSGTATNAGSATGLGPGATGSNLTLTEDLGARHINASGVVTATDANFTGNVSIAGTLTYEDVTNIDSVGLITARDGLQVTGGIATVSGQTNLANVNVSAASTFSGKINANSGVGFTGFLREGINIVSGKLSDNTTINIDHSMAHYFTTTETTTAIPNITSTAGINTDLSVGETFSVNVITTAAAAGYSTGARIDAGATLPVLWNGGDDPSEGGSSGVDVYTYQVIKTASATFTILGNVSNFA